MGKERKNWEGRRYRAGRSKSRRRESVIRISSHRTVHREAVRVHYGNLPFLSNASMKMYNIIISGPDLAISEIHDTILSIEPR